MKQRTLSLHSTNNCKIVVAAAVLGASAYAFVPPSKIISCGPCSSIITKATGLNSPSDSSVVYSVTTENDYETLDDLKASLPLSQMNNDDVINTETRTMSSSDASEFFCDKASSPLLESPYPFPASSDLSTSSSILEALRTPSMDEKRQEFELKLGKALDTLKKDYPKILTEKPDFSIYHNDIEVVDPSGVTLHSVQSYKTAFQFLHIVFKLFYCPERSLLTFRLVYDCARKNIRVSWNAEIVPRQIYGGIRNSLFIDGISIYEFDLESGLIHQHRVEHLLLNDAPVLAPKGIFHAIASEASQGPEGVPVWNMNTEFTTNNSLEFKSWDAFGSKSILFSSPMEDMERPSQDITMFDEGAFNRKNAARKKFGLQPITPDEFIKIEAETRELEKTQRKNSSSTSSAAEITKPGKKGNLVSKLFGNVLADTCESNWDCEKPEVCCDFGFKKMCCRSGMGVFNGSPGQLREIPVQVIADDHTHVPRGGPDGDQYY